MKKYTDLSLETYLEKLASDAPVPGGGSVSAYAGALGMGLTQMVARIALKRKPKAGLTEEQKFQDEANLTRSARSVMGEPPPPPTPAAASADEAPPDSVPTYGTPPAKPPLIHFTA